MTKLLPTDQRIKDLIKDPLLFRYTLYWLNKVERDREKGMLKALGILWEKEDIIEKPNKSTEKPDTLLVPLSVQINPKILEFVKKNLQTADNTNNYDGLKGLIGENDIIIEDSEIDSSILSDVIKNQYNNSKDYNKENK